MVRGRRILKETQQKSKRFQHKKDLGQNFIEDKELLEELVELAEISSSDKVLEIGPGSGNLTELLISKGKTVLAIEIDDRLIPFLKLKENRYPHFNVIHGDILSLNFDNDIFPFFQEEKMKVVENIPYYMTKDILQVLLKYRERISFV